MCGICGIAGRDTRRPPVHLGRLRAMTDVIRHRGPDEDGLHVEPGVALGMRRLSVIDLAGSHQPVTTEDGGVRAVFNGEIYNFAELRRDLIARGHRLATNGDAEPIVHLYEQYGVDFAAPPARDVRHRPVGRPAPPARARPRPHGRQAAVLGADAGRPRVRLRGQVADRRRPRSRPQLDPLAAELFLAHGFVPGPRTLFAGVNKLPPASVLVWEDGRLVDEHTYWDPYVDGEDRPQPELRRGHGAAARAAARGDRHADGRRRAARRDAQRRPRLEPDHRDHGRALHAARPDVLDRLRRGRRLQRARRRAARGRAARDRPSRADDERGRPPGPARRGAVAHGGARRRRLLPGLPAAQPAGARDRDRGPLRAGRRRAARRLPQARDRRARHQSPPRAGRPAARGGSCRSDRAGGLDARARDRSRDHGRPGRAPARDEPGRPVARARRAARPGLHAPGRRGRDRRPWSAGSSGRVPAQPARRDAPPRHAPRARGQHAPVLRQDVDGDVARGPGPVHGPQARRVLHAPAGLPPRLPRAPQGDPQAREPRPGRGRDHRQAQARVLPLGARRLARRPSRRARERDAARRARARARPVSRRRGRAPDPRAPAARRARRAASACSACCCSSAGSGSSSTARRRGSRPTSRSPSPREHGRRSGPQRRRRHPQRGATSPS